MSNRARDDKAGIVMLGVTSTGAKIPVLVDDIGVLSDSPATGLATSAKQDTQIIAEQAILAKLPTVGTAGTASANVISVQGIASGTALAVNDAAFIAANHTDTIAVTAAVVALPSAANASTTAATMAQGTKAVAAAGTPERLVGSTTKVESVEIFARKNPTTANTGNIYVGFSASGGSNLRVLEPGEGFGLSAPLGKKIDLNLIYIDSATSSDAVQFTSIA